MEKAIRTVATVVALLFVMVAIYIGLSGSWPTAVLLFLLAGGVEFTAYALGAGAAPDADKKSE